MKLLIVIVDMKRKITLLLALCIMGVLASCNDEKKEEEVDNCAEGRTGNLTLVTRMVHHQRPIVGCRVFIKFNALEFPGEDTTKYDFAFSANAQSAYASVDSLACGDYYVYAIGIDSMLPPTNWVCKGGLPYRTTLSAGTDSINVYITEGD